MNELGGHAPGEEILGRYRLVRHIATGGMGVVWEARDTALDQTVALKHVSFSQLPGADADETRRRTLREARFAAQLRGHHHVVAIYDVQDVGGDVWLVLEYLPSRSLAEMTEKGTTLDIGEVARIGAAIADALAAAHERGIIHRDVKPGNVLLSLDGGQVKLTDFGISHAEGEHPLTRTNVVSGTPAYMSREVARGDDETFASDVFSLGATLYKAVEGIPPFGEDTNSRRMLQRVAHGQIEPPRRAGPFGPLLMHLLELDPNVRPDARLAHRLLDGFARRLQDPTQPPTVLGWVPTPSSAGAGGPAGSARNGGPPPVPDEPGALRPKRRAVLAVTAALVVLAAVAGGAYWVTRPDPTAVPELPETVSALGLTGDPVAADPCALVRPSVMQRFGATQLGPGSQVGECRLTISPAGSAPVFTEVRFSTVDAEAPTPSEPPRNLGGMQIVLTAVTPEDCSAYLQLTDGTLVSLESRVKPSAGAAPNLCQIRDTVIAVAVDELAENGATYTPGWQKSVTLYGKKSCELPNFALAAVPGLLTTQRIGHPNGSTCYIGSQQNGTPYLTMFLRLETTGYMSGYGTPSTVEGKTVYTQPGVARKNSGNPRVCEVYLVHKPTYDGGASGPTEIIDVQLEGTAPEAELCRQATAVALGSERDAG